MLCFFIELGGIDSCLFWCEESVDIGFVGKGVVIFGFVWYCDIGISGVKNGEGGFCVVC